MIKLSAAIKILLKAIAHQKELLGELHSENEYHFAKVWCIIWNGNYEKNCSNLLDHYHTIFVSVSHLLDTSLESEIQ